MVILANTLANLANVSGAVGYLGMTIEMLSLR
jgi:hypothetical protein